MSKVQCGLCVDPCFRVFHTRSHFWNQHHSGKSRLCNCKHHFSLCTDSFWIPKYCFM